MLAVEEREELAVVDCVVEALVEALVLCEVEIGTTGLSIPVCAQFEIVRIRIQSAPVFENSKITRIRSLFENACEASVSDQTKFGQRKM
ncbi:MAG: hypothetical protein JSW58_08415 [Candidatus Latescibacterota bacterium]|nr:MAG: hypothetical protein JSW58_08415 [Candidatus Latescibacterota bacterium]